MVDADRPVRWYYDPADNVTVQNVTVDFMYTPHSMLALSTLIGALLAAFFYYDSGAGFANTARNVKYGLALAAGAFLLSGLLVFPAGPFTRPHPLFWRLVFGVSV
jgi:phosphatidylserine synthase 1